MSSDDFEEVHTFRCVIADFKDFLDGKAQYRYEIECGQKFGEVIPISFQMYLPSKEGKNIYYRESHHDMEYLGLKAGVDEIIKKPISLIIVPRLLKSDMTIYHFGVSRQIKLNVEKSMNWTQFFKIEDLHKIRGLSLNNKVTVEFEVKLFPQNPKSILIKPTIQEKKSPTNVQRPGNSNTGKASNSASNGSNSSQAKQLQNKSGRDNDIEIIESKPKEAVKLEAMHLKLTTDLRSVLMSQDRADVNFVVKEGTVVKGHRLILEARSNMLKEMLSDDKKGEDGIWTVQAEDLEPAIMHNILEYAYTGKLAVDFEKNVHQLLLAAHKFQLRELIEYLDLKVPDLLTVDNISNFLILSKEMELKHLEQVMTKYFVEHRAEVVQTPGFAELREKNPGILVDWLLALN